MRFGIYANLTRDKNGKATIELAELLKQKGLPFIMSDELSTLNYPCEYVSNEELAKRCDVIIVLGGDGTVLRIAKECVKSNCSIFAVNFGNIGFLTETEQEDISSAIAKICKNKTKTEKRYLLELEFKSKKHLAMNEIAVNRGAKAKTVYLDIMVNNVLVNRLRADGVIVSTPTGSTAYSLSAGGPVVSPDVEAIIITPVSPHSFNSKPFVIPSNSAIEIYLTRAEPCAYINVDGDMISEININEHIKIKNSNLYVKFIRLEGYNFYNNIVQKLNC